MFVFDPFDHPTLVDGEGWLIALPTKQIAVILAILLYERGPVTRPKLVEWVWPEAAPEDGRASLRNALCRIRKILPESSISSSGNAIHLDTSNIKGVALKDVPHFPVVQLLPGMNWDWVERFRANFNEGMADACLEKSHQAESPEEALRFAELASQWAPLSSCTRTRLLGLLEKHNLSEQKSAASARLRQIHFRELGTLPPTEGASEVSRAEHPLFLTAKHMAQRHAEEAAEFLLNIGEQWSEINVAQGLKVHDEVLSLLPPGSAIRVPLMTQKLMVQWALKGLNGHFEVAEDTFDQALLVGEPYLAVKVAQAICYGLQSKGDFTSAIQWVKRIEQLEDRIKGSSLQKGKRNYEAGVIRLHSQNRPVDQRALARFSEELRSSPHPQDRAEGAFLQIEGALATGKLADGLSALEYCRNFHETSHAHRKLSWIYMAEARIHEAANDPEAALTSLLNVEQLDSNALGHCALCCYFDHGGMLATQVGEFAMAAEYFYAATAVRKKLSTTRSKFEMENTRSARSQLAVKLSQKEREILKAKAQGRLSKIASLA